MSPNSKANAGTRKTGVRSSPASRPLTCTNCRSRKTRCDGSQPSCKTCEVYHDTCRYEKLPPMSQILAMKRRIQELEETVAKLSTAKPLEPALSMTTPEASTSPVSREFHPMPPPTPLPAGLTPPYIKEQNDPEGLSPDLSLDENGKLCYHGPTSAVHDPLLLNQNQHFTQRQTPPPSEPRIRSTASSCALASREWEEFALRNAAMQIDIPIDAMKELLDIHWSWVSPGFPWVYRPAFLRDMATGGPYFSHFLLLVMCAHAARFQKGHMSHLLNTRVRAIIGSEIAGQCSIPTVQAFIQLSAGEWAMGSVAQAWLYSGIAFRMMVHMGIDHTSSKIVDLGHLTPEDYKIRRRLFWSCYLWDKAISLYLGRMPTILEIPSFDDFGMYDSAEEEIWRPYYGKSGNLTIMPLETYPSMKSHAMSCFENSCKLWTIISDIILYLYSRRSPTDLDQRVQSIRERLYQWRVQTPLHLVLDLNALPAVCCPPHILTQNLLFFTAMILLHRAAGDHATCRSAAEHIEKLLLLLENTFDFTRITYLMAYCIYTGASALVQDFKLGSPEAHTTMSTFLRALNVGVLSCPILQRSLDIINNSISIPQPKISTPNSMQDSSAAAPTNYLPAFPYYDANVECTGNENYNFINTDPALFLNSFPEMQHVVTNGDWMENFFQ